MSDLNEDRTVAFDEHSANKDRTALIGVADVPKARLVCTDRSQVEGALPGDGVIHLVPGAEQTVGRGETCTYPIGSRKLSRQHARIFPGVGAWGVEDLNSTNGVRVNDDKVHTAWLKHGDVVRIGPIPFHFEVDRPDAAAAAAIAAAVAAHRPAADSGDGEHTMMFSGTGGAKAAEVMLKAVREAEKTDEPPPTIVPTTPSKATQKPPTKSTKINNGRILGLILAATAVVVLIAGGIIYYPAFRKAQEITALIDRGSHLVDRVIARSRDFSGATTTEGAYLEDIKALQPIIRDTGDALLDNPDNRDLANLHARARFLVFEREFSGLFNRQDADGEVLKGAGRKAVGLRSDLDKIEHQLPPQTGASDQDTLKTAADLADLGAILVSYRTFSRKFPKIAKAGADQPAPALDQVNTVDIRKRDFIQYSKSYHQILTRDYRIFNTLVSEVEKDDFALVSRWREFLGTGH